VIDSDGEIEEIGVSTGGSRTSFENWPTWWKKGDKVAGKGMVEAWKYLRKTADTDL
jgi:hypothetical protein